MDWCALILYPFTVKPETKHNTRSLLSVVFYLILKLQPTYTQQGACTVYYLICNEIKYYSCQFSVK